MHHNDIDVIIYKNRFQIKYVCICELINKLFTFANFHQIGINNNDYDRDNCVNYIEFKKHFALLI